MYFKRVNFMACELFVSHTIILKIRVTFLVNFEFIGNCVGRKCNIYSYGISYSL